MAVLELKINSASINPGDCSVNATLWARGDIAYSDNDLGLSVGRYPRQKIGTRTFNETSIADLKQLVKQKVLAFYEQLTPAQKLQITGIAIEQQ